MLVLSRKAGEQINIGEEITIEVRRVAGNRVALAVQAPRDVRILRGELKEASEAFDEKEPERHAEGAGFSVVVDDSQYQVAAASA